MFPTPFQPILHCEALVIGAGAAGLNAADELKKAGVHVLLVADSLNGGTSLNAGSDKQTYYKLALSGSTPDSVSALAQSFYAGGGMHGDHAYAMAALSARSFLKLAQLGVPFPHNEWGEYVGYQTDHDASQRATSAGPLTSRMMAEALMRSVRARGVRMREGLLLSSLLTDARGAVCGAFFLDQNDAQHPYVLVNAPSVILCTGGPAEVYEKKVFPDAQTGATGAALRAGAAANNLCYWQYGLASTKVKWNVSGSYQQAIPSYTDGKSEALRAFFQSEADLANAVFLKGYQWPFDARKATGSSRVDLAVQALSASGKTVYMDFTKKRADVLPLLDKEASEYLAQCGALVAHPFERLQRINQKAVDFYASHGIELWREPLEVAVCAQHANGGLLIDSWWRTTIDGLYAAGECAGAFGVYRPGGSALNETQVGSLRAAQHIAAHHRATPSEEVFLSMVQKQAETEAAWLYAAEHGGRNPSQATESHNAARREMDRAAGVRRDVERMAVLERELERAYSALDAGEALPKGASSAIRARDAMRTQRAALSAMRCQADFSGDAGHIVARTPSDSAPDASKYAIETRGTESRAVPLRPLPEGGGWFETVWKAYLANEVWG